ncbi:MAG: lipopolysaccharide kinase InaA family protein [Gammaproteobacteria bacterium]
MKTILHITSQYQQTAIAQYLTNFDDIFALHGEKITRSPISDLIKLKIGGEYYYVKRYNAAGKRLRRYIGRSRIRGEWENMQFFQQLNIAIPDIVAYGQQQQTVGQLRGVIVTKELTNSMDLATMARERHSLLRNYEWVKQVSQQLALATQKMHHHKFAHGDLKWRNILVTLDTQPKVHLIDCPLGKKYRSFMFAKYRIKDLACLDKIAKFTLSRPQRLRFYKYYASRRKLTIEDKFIIKKILRYFK